MQKSEINASKTRTVGETAAILGVSIPTLRRAIAAGEVQVIRVGSRVLISERFLENMLAGKENVGRSEPQCTVRRDRKA